MHSQALSLNIAGQQVNVSLRSDIETKNMVEIRGVKYSVGIAGVDEHLEEFILSKLREVLKHPSTTSENLQEKLREHIKKLGDDVRISNVTEILSPPSEELQNKRKVFENGLLPARIPKGEKIIPSNIEDRMNALKIPNVSVIVIDEGKEVLKKSYGQMNIKGVSKPCHENVRFQSASIGKAITALAILKLVENSDGKIDLDTDVNNYLTSWKLPSREGAPTEEKVTLRMLLSHTGGINCNPGLAGFKPDQPLPNSTSELLEGKNSAFTDTGIWGEAVRVVNPPGVSWDYSAGGYLILQQVLEDCVNKDKSDEKLKFSEIIEQMIFEPLAMKNSSYDFPDENKIVALGHDVDGKEVSGGYHLYPEQGPAGFWTTSSDLIRFIKEIQRSQEGEGVVLKSRLAQSMLTPQKIIVEGETKTTNWGLGIGVCEDEHMTRFMHAGHNEGYCAMIVGFNQEGKAAVIMTNSENGECIIPELLGSIANAYGWPSGLKPSPLDLVSVDPKEFKALEGDYLLHERTPPISLKIEMEDDKLYAKTSMLPLRTRLYPVDTNKFLILESGEEFTFIHKDENVVEIKSNREEKLFYKIK